jgi:RNA polymerase sigma-B factor
VSEESWTTRRAEAGRLLVELNQCTDEDAKAKLRDQVIEIELPLVRYLARRFTNRGIPLDDLVQVGCVGLIKAVDRFEPGRGVEFSSFAAPTILGEIKRYFRDAGWLLRVPRRAQELQTSIDKARADLTQELMRSPTVRELAERIGAEEDEVVEALDVYRGYSGVPLDVLLDPETGARQDVIAMIDGDLANVDLREALRPAFEQLPETEREILVLRFFGGRTQAEIARLIGVSQMQVSRLITRALAHLRESLPNDVE